MRVLVAGATGVLGRPLTPLLGAAGHEVIALGRPGPRLEALGESGIEVVTADALDREAVAAAVRRAAPDAVVNLLTAIPAAIDPKRMTRDFAVTNRLRSEASRYLAEAATAVGVRRLIAEGLAYGYDPDGTGPATEDTRFWPQPPGQFRPVLSALQDLERHTMAAGGLVLRFGHLYGPGSSYAADGSFTALVRAGRLPIVGRGGAVFSFIHAQDAATALVAAIGAEVTGALNIVDDEPARVADWLPELARLLGARAPRRVPAALARLAVGEWGVAFMTRLRGADNSRAKLRLDWRPRYGSWRAGFAAELAAGPERQAGRGSDGR